MVSERSFLRSVDLGCPLSFLCVSLSVQLKFLPLSSLTK